MVEESKRAVDGINEGADDYGVGSIMDNAYNAEDGDSAVVDRKTGWEVPVPNDSKRLPDFLAMNYVPFFSYRDAAALQLASRSFRESLSRLMGTCSRVVVKERKMLMTVGSRDVWKRRGGWGSPSPLGKWEGVTMHTASSATNAELGLVLRLQLPLKRLTGNIPVELGQLVNLERLWLMDNKLTGSIPVELGQLANLKQLVLYGNKLTGNIPVELGRLVKLTKLYLNENQLTGSIPVDLGRLGKLSDLDLSFNKLSGVEYAKTELKKKLTGCRIMV